ncbi:MAG: hypothetical protein HC850_12985, partial [Rhodomicrobium sp.]|nr:hypothetical protein [Rhodomicrobium sp.]
MAQNPYRINRLILCLYNKPSSQDVRTIGGNGENVSANYTIVPIDGTITERLLSNPIMFPGRKGQARARMGSRLKKTIELGDAGAFRTLFLTYGPKVRALMMRQGTDRDTAEEIAQETMLAVWAKIAPFLAAEREHFVLDFRHCSESED